MARRPRGAILGVVVTLALATAGAGCAGDGSPDAVVRRTTPAAPLVAAFSYEVEMETTGPTSCPATGVRFTDESEGGPTEWLWELGDGTTSTEQNPERTDAPAFGEEVTLTVTRGAASDSVTQTIEYAVC